MRHLLAHGVALACVARALGLSPTARPTPRPTIMPTVPTAPPTTAPSFQPSFTCSYDLTNSDYAQKAIFACPNTMLLCPGDTVTIGKCDPTDKVACYGDQYFILAKYNPTDQLYNNIVQYNDNCKYQDGRYTKEISCSVISYTVPVTESCARFGLTMACGGSGNCGGVVPVNMPGTPSTAPVGQPTLAPVRKRSILGKDSLGSDFAGEYEFIIFVISLAVFIFLSGTFALCLRFNPRFNHWFWSLEFFTKSFLGHQPVAEQSEIKQSEVELWGYESSSSSEASAPLAPSRT